MRVLGVDPGMGNCGFGVLDLDESFEPRVLDAGCFRSDRELSVAVRLRELSRDFVDVIALHSPGAIICEAPTVLRDASSTGWLWAAYGALLGAASTKATVFDRTSDQWRKALGLPTGRDLAKRHELSANARRTEHKRLTRAYVLARFPSLPRLLATMPADAVSHAMDAIAIACAWVASCKPTNPEAVRAAVDHT